MPDTTVQFKGPMGEVVLSVDLNNILIELTRICNDSLSTAAFQVSTQGKGVIYRHPYIPVGAPSVGDIPQWTAGTPNAYVPTSVGAAIGFDFQVVASSGSLTTPTRPAFGFTQDTQQYYIYSGGWKLIGTVEP